MDIATVLGPVVVFDPNLANTCLPELSSGDTIGIKGMATDVSGAILTLASSVVVAPP